jgi:hypothetical protein
MEANFIKRSQNSGVTTMEIYMSPLVVRPRDRATLSPLLLPSSSARRFSSSSRPPRARPSNPARRSPVAVGVPPPPPVLQSPPSPDHLYISEKLARVLPPPSPPPPPPINLPRPPHLGLCHSCQLSSMDSDLPHSDIALALGFGPACREEEDEGVGPGHGASCRLTPPHSLAWEPS